MLFGHRHTSRQASEVGHIDFQLIGQLPHDRPSGIADPALDFRQIGSVHTGICRERFDTEPAIFSQVANSKAELGSRGRRQGNERASRCRNLIPTGYILRFGTWVRMEICRGTELIIYGTAL